jgi:nucleotide-binding universal stress UspA family protein
MIRIKNVLVATDFSGPSAAALRYGRELAGAFGASLEVLHVTDNVYMTHGAELLCVPALPEFQRQVEEAVRRQVDNLLTEEDRQRLHARAVIVTAVGQAQAIVGYAQQHAIDVIVMGTHGRGSLSDVFMGSVAERVVRLSTCPVLTVHHPRHESPAPDGPAAVTLARV